MYNPFRFETTPQGPVGHPSREGFLAFLANKDPDERFNWQSCFECAIAQYAKSIGMDYFELGKAIGTPGLHTWNNVVSAGNWTFGEAYLRFEQFIKTGEVYIKKPEYSYEGVDISDWIDEEEFENA